MEKLSCVDPEFPCYSHVDDISHVLVGETDSDLKAKLLSAGRIVGGEVKRLHLKLSDKSTLLPQNEGARAVAAILSAEGIPVKTATTGDDVGVQMSGSKVRRAKTLNTRIKVKCRDRAKRTRALVKTNRKAMKLTMTGTHPTQSYGHVAQGASTAQMLAMTKNIKDTTPFAGTRACTTTVVAWLFGPNTSPMVRCPLEQIDMWVQTWNATSREDRHDTRFTWQKHLTAFLTSGKLLNPMGPVAGTINAVLRTGWKPAFPDLWQVEKGTNVVVDDQQFSRFQTIAKAFVDLQAKTWERAAQHEHGGGA